MPQGAARILLVDRDPIVRKGLAEALEAAGHQLTRAGTLDQAIDCLRAERFGLVIAEADPPGGRPLALLRHVKCSDAAVPVIVTADCGTVPGAVEAMRLGAADYLPKPIRKPDLLAAVQRELKRWDVDDRSGAGAEDRSGGGFETIISHDVRMAEVFDLVVAVADSDTTVLITGESGTGKSLVARAIHARSARRVGPFVEVSCGALAETLLETELFGHVRGAFTDAVADKPGKFAAAAGGTLFLDEIAMASPQLQVKLLRVLQERQFEPVGSNETIAADVRVILATNRDLWAEVQAGRFRQDLYYRVNVVHIELPPLRDRPGDVPLLARHFLDKCLAAANRRIVGFSAEALELMQRYAWPGNIRELANCVERAVVLCRGAFVAPDDLPPAILRGLAAGSSAAVHLPPPDQIGPLKAELAQPEKQILLAALRANNGSRQAAAAQLGINRTTLYKKMKKHGLMG